MGEGDYMPRGGHKRKYDPKYAQKVKEGGKRAETIREKTNRHHKAVEVPAAEEELLKDLEEI
ncbi:hypothetical protein KJ742_07390 [Patescibacteria group bacterium]|nr:hypothetical protein [Patescibacteria group bacterium]MBU1683734.1 hypothetical protein [Patescibacteria group bacterium]